MAGNVEGRNSFKADSVVGPRDFGQVGISCYDSHGRRLTAVIRILSCLLGRPPMIRKNEVDVAIPPYIEPDGSKNRYNRGLALFIQLADIAEETLEKV